MKNNRRKKRSSVDRIRYYTPTTNRVRTITTISPETKRWIVALAMLEDLRGFCYTDAPRDDELLRAVEGVRKVINEYLTEQIRISIAEGNAWNKI